jgi:hypothetical protein
MHARHEGTHRFRLGERWPNNTGDICRCPTNYDTATTKGPIPQREMNQAVGELVGCHARETEFDIVDQPSDQRTLRRERNPTERDALPLPLLESKEQRIEPRRQERQSPMTPSQSVAVQAALSRRRSSNPSDPSTRARTLPMLFGSISGTDEALRGLARRKVV